VTAQGRNGTLEPGDPRHGRASSYENYACRCRPCTAAKVGVERARRASRGERPADRELQQELVRGYRALDGLHILIKWHPSEEMRAICLEWRRDIQQRLELLLREERAQ
jgi:hypothetical protein